MNYARFLLLFCICYFCFFFHYLYWNFDHFWHGMRQSSCRVYLTLSIPFHVIFYYNNSELCMYFSDMYSMWCVICAFNKVFFVPRKKAPASSIPLHTPCMHACTHIRYNFCLSPRIVLVTRFEFWIDIWLCDNWRQLALQPKIKFECRLSIITEKWKWISIFLSTKLSGVLSPPCT